METISWVDNEKIHGFLYPLLIAHDTYGCIKKNTFPLLFCDYPRLGFELKLAITIKSVFYGIVSFALKPQLSFFFIDQTNHDDVADLGYSPRLV